VSAVNASPAAKGSPAAGDPVHALQHALCRAAKADPGQRFLANALRAWLIDGDVVSPSGAYHAWFDPILGTGSFEYPEITGYALTHLTGLNVATEEERTRTQRAADWLVQRWESGNRAARDGWENGGVYYFDSAMVANGLLQVGEKLCRPDATRVGLEIVDMITSEVGSRGCLPPLPTGQHSSRHGWSVDGLAHMGKTLQCLHHAARVAPSKPLESVIEIVLAQTLAAQKSDGRFVTEAADEITMLHPHFYAVEGLWCHAQATGDPTAAEAARAGTAWAWRHQLPSGGLPRFVVRASGEVSGIEQLDVIAQGVRAAVLTGTSHDAAWRAGERLATLAVGRGSGRAGLPYQAASSEHHLNAWVTMFGSQALTLLLHGASTLVWDSLV